MPLSPKPKVSGMADYECPFCRKVATLDEQSPDEVIWQFPYSVAFLGSWQYYHGYCVLASRRHATELHELSADERRAFLDEMCLLARAICDAFRPEKLNYELLGNQVPHLHWHLFPRYLDDPQRLKPVWLAIEDAGRNQTARRRLEIGTMGRSETVARLLDQLSSTGMKAHGLSL
jgi:diadenosine tetraphosphate (Ap4A) HIT family hydrolase